MNFLEHTMAGMDMLFAAMAKPPVFQPDTQLGTIVLRWDGVDRLTVDGERHFAIYVETRQALAEAIFKLACPDETVSEAEIERFCAEVLVKLDSNAFTLCSDSVQGWLRRLA